MPDPCIDCGNDTIATRCESCGGNVCGECEVEGMCSECAEFHFGPNYNPEPNEEAMHIDKR